MWSEEGVGVDVVGRVRVGVGGMGCWVRRTWVEGAVMRVEVWMRRCFLSVETRIL